MFPKSSVTRSTHTVAMAAAAAALLGATPAPRAADPFEMEWRELALGVWVGERPVSYRSPVMTNTTVVIGDKGVLVFDAAGLAIQGERLVKKVAELTDKPITHIAISHWHGDHSMGDYKVLEKFPAAEVIAHEFTARYNASPNGRRSSREMSRERTSTEQRSRRRSPPASAPTARRSRRRCAPSTSSCSNTLASSTKKSRAGSSRRRLGR